jgi:hypothetical protein
MFIYLGVSDTEEYTSKDTALNPVESCMTEMKSFLSLSRGPSAADITVGNIYISLNIFVYTITDKYLHVYR